MDKNANKTLLLRIATVALAIVFAFVIGFVRGRMQAAVDQPTPTVVEQPGDPGQETPTPTPTEAPPAEPEPAPEPEPDPQPSSPTDDDYRLVFYPAQTGVDPDDVFVYGEPIGVPSNVVVYEDEAYTSMEEVALYIHTFGHVPPNFVSKTKARKAGWVAEEGNLQDVLPGMCIGGGGWHNDEAVMPGDEWDQWYECDINYDGGFRGPERLVYSDNGMIFYTQDHYESYARIY